MMIDALNLAFIQNALLAGLLISIACGIIGSLVVVNRMVFIAGGIAHASYGGIGLAFFYNFPPLIGAVLFSLLSSITIGLITFANKHRLDTIIGVIWALGMAFGIIMTDLTPGYNVDLMSYLFGSILSVSKLDLFLMTIMNIIIGIAVMAFYRPILAMSYDEEFAKSIGIKTKSLYFLLLILIGLTVVMTIQAVGLILVIALLTIPAYIAEKYSKSLNKMMLISSLLSGVFVFSGLFLSYIFNLTSGATIITIAGILFTIIMGTDNLLSRFNITLQKQ